MIGKDPCFTCGERSTTCHATCEAYNTWAQERRNESIHTSKATAALDKMYDYGGKWRRCVYYGRRKK